MRPPLGAGGAITPLGAHHLQPIDEQRRQQDQHHDADLYDAAGEELGNGVAGHQERVGGHIVGRQQRHCGILHTVVAQREGTQLVTGLDGGHGGLVDQRHLALQLVGGHIVGQQHTDLLGRVDKNGAGLLAQGHGHLLHQVRILQHRLQGEIIIAPVVQRGGVHEAHGLLLAVNGPRSAAQHHGDEPAAIPHSGGHQAIARLVGGAGLDALGPVIEIAQHAPVGDKGVGGVELPDVGHVGGRHIIGLAAHDGHERLVFHSLPGEQIDVPSCGIMVRVVEPVGICEVGAGAAKLRRPLVHQVHKGADGAADGLGQDVGRLVGGDDQQAIEQLLHRQHLADLYPGGAAVCVQVGQSRLGGGDGLVQPQLAPVHCLQRQEGRHDLGDAGWIVFGMLILAVQHPLAVGLVDQQGSPGVQVRVRQGVGPGRQAQRGHQNGQ